METTSLVNINPNIPLSFLQASPPILQAAIRTAGSINSLPEIVALSTEPKIATLQKKGGSQSTFGIVKALLVAMNINLHIDNSLTEANINNLARQLTTNDEVRYWLTLADIDLLCRQIVQGHFGKFYNHFSENEFNECLVKYCNERSEIHRIEADKTVCNPNNASLTMKELGYSIDKEGRLQVPDEMKNRSLPEPPYLYDDKGRRVGINPKGYFGKGAAKDKVYSTAKALMKAEPRLTFDKAIDKAEQLINSTNNQDNQQKQ